MTKDQERPQELTDISSLGEFGLIEHLTKDIQLRNPETLTGVGDDAAVIDNGPMATIVTQRSPGRGCSF